MDEVQKKPKVIQLKESETVFTELPKNNNSKNYYHLAFGSGASSTQTERAVSLETQLEKYVGIPSITGWKVIDSNSKLALIHHVNDSELGSLRGDIYDINTGVRVAASYGHTPVAICDSLVLQDSVLKIEDKNGIQHTFSTDSLKIQPLFEGTILRVFLFDGVVYYSGHKKIDTTNSHWGGGIRFVAAYHEGGGPNPSLLFDLKKKYNPYCHIFLVCHPDLLVATKQRVKKPYVVYLETREMYDVEKCPYPKHEIDNVKREFPVKTKIGKVMDETGTYLPLELTIEQANKHLKVGYYHEIDNEEKRLLPSEALLISDGKDMIKVHSTGYEWRVWMRGDCTSIKFRFYELVDLIKKHFDKFVNFTPPHASALKKEFHKSGHILVLSDLGTKSENLKFIEKMRILWTNFVFVLPCSKQELALGLYEEFFADRRELIRLISELVDSNEYIENKHVYKIVCDVRNCTYKLQGKNYTKAVNERILTLLENDSAVRIHRMLRAIS